MRTGLLAIRTRSVEILLASILGFAVQASGQAVSNPNQIFGTIEFSNTNPLILNILEPYPGAGAGFQQVVVDANSIAVSPPLNNSTVFVASGHISTPFELTVESGPPGNGIEYDAGVSMFLDLGKETYQFSRTITDPVIEEPAPAVEANFSECVGLLDIRWETPSGIPVQVDGGNIHAYRESSPGSGTFQLQAKAFSFAIGTDQEYLAVRGDGSLYRADIVYETGTDPFNDKIRFVHEASVEVSCDEIVEIVCVVPEGGDDGELGTIIGEVDFLGENENAVGAYTAVVALSGPFGNFRYDTVDGPTPSEGPFKLKNLVPSDTVNPALGYQVYGSMSLRVGRRSEAFRTPILDGSNGRVFVSAGQTEDLADTFVMDPGFVKGEIFLRGPQPTAHGSCLEDIYRDSITSDANGVPLNFHIPNSSVQAYGSNTPAAGATKTAFGGYAAVLFEGEFNPNPSIEAFEGDYEMVLGGLFQESSIWTVQHLKLHFNDVATPDVAESVQYSLVTINDLNMSPLEIVPGQTLDAPIRRCFGQLDLSFVSTASDFFRPRINGSGSFSGSDFELNPANYSVGVFASGTPGNSLAAATEGLVVACLPEGTYSFTPFVVSVNPSGGTSDTELPPVLDLEVVCGQIKAVTLGLAVNLDSLPACITTTEPVVPLSGSASSTGSVPVFIEKISATVNSGPTIPFCTNCGTDPSFAFEVPLDVCENEITVIAEDEFGRVSSTTGSTRFDPVAPVLAGCDDLVVEGELDQTGEVVDFLVTATDGCDGNLPVQCDLPSGSVFPFGQSQVTCTSSDACGNEASCTFTVTVNDPACSETWHWPLDEGSGIVTMDLSDHGDDGILIGDPDWTLGQQGSGLACGDGGFVRVDDNDALDLVEAITIAAWVKPASLGTTQMLLSKNNVYEFEIGKASANAYSVRLNNVRHGQGATPVQVGVWQHLAVTWDGAMVRYYRNGQPDGSSPFAGPLTVNDTEVGLCARPYDLYEGCPVFFFDGTLDDVRLSGCALSEEEIQELVNSTLNDTSPPVATEGAPSGSLLAGTTETTLSLATDETAICRFSTASGLTFGEMTDTFVNTGGTQHSTLFNGLQDDQLYRIFVRCQDAVGNANPIDFEIAFGVADDVFTGAAGYWRFDENTGCTSADARGDNEGLLGPHCLVDAPQWTPGAVNSGLSFSGGAQEVQVAAAADLDVMNEVTIAAWIRHDATNSFHSIVDKRDSHRDGYDLYIVPGSKLFLRVNDATLTSNTRVADGSWHHVVGVYDGSELRLYVDGLLDITSVVGSMAIATTSHLHIGRHYSNSSASFAGAMDEVLVQRRALSSDEVAELYQALQ